MTEFTKTKIHFALALLGSLFALHPFLERVQDKGFVYLGYDLKIYYAYILIAGLLALCVYCFGLTLVSEKPHSWLERLGNYVYALAVMVLPLYGGLYLASLLADQLNASHLAWAAPTAALGLGIAWFILSQFLAFLLRGRLSNQDRSAKIEQFALQETNAVRQASELFETEHYDLCVMETWRAVEARLRQVLLRRGINIRKTSPAALIAAAKRAAIVTEPTLRLLQALEKTWHIAMSSEPTTRAAASEALTAGRQILATTALHAGEPAS
jgi:HEPN domain-containing protein